MSEPTEGTDPLEPIRRVKQRETEFEARRAEAERHLREELEAVRRATEAAIAQARQAAETARDEMLARTRSEADREAESILAEGRANAARRKPKSPEELDQLREAILDASLGEFRPPRK